MNLHTSCGVSLASNEVRYRSAHPTNSHNCPLNPKLSRANSEQWLDAIVAETIRFERMVPISRALRVSSAAP